MSYISRIAKLKGYKDIVAGRDLARLLDFDKVYAITKVAGVIMLHEIGDQAQHKLEELRDGSYGHKFSTIIMEGVFLLTKEEYAAQRKIEISEGDGTDKEYALRNKKNRQRKISK